jgi:hypothetical protein
VYVPRLKGETWDTRAFEAVEAERLKGTGGCGGVETLGVLRLRISR